MRIIPAIGRLGVLMWVVQASAQETSSLTVSRDPDAALGADDFGKIGRRVEAVVERFCSYKQSEQCCRQGDIQTQWARHHLCIARASGTIADGARRRKLSPFPVLRQPGKCAFA